ncbi:SseB family protein [Microbacterium sp. G2-8]|uniref:SseB family protein n=1 Tax=Microbacterium sp. G2-8 TaxID=2842454 RepID=UPI001C891A39|nr:SseB family protein [Microbacterium sp. G2-8]
MTSPEQPKNIVENARVQEALDTWAEQKDPRAHSDVLRRTAAGQLLLDISHSEFADPENPMQENDKLVVTSVHDSEGKDLLLAFTDNPRLESFSQAEKTTSLAQPAAAALLQALEHHDGIAIDAGTDGTFIAYNDEVRRAFGDDLGEATKLAAAIVDGGVELDEFVRMMKDAVVYIGGIPVKDDEGDIIGYNVASATRPDGESLHAVFTSPAELWAWEPGAVAQPTKLDRVVASARNDGMAGLVVNPVGPAAELKMEWFEESA